MGKLRHKWKLQSKMFLCNVGQWFIPLLHILTNDTLFLSALHVITCVLFREKSV